MNRSDEKVERIIRCGYVSAVDYAKGYVKVTYPDLDDSVTDWLPMMTNGGEYKMPKVGQQVVAAHLPNGQDSGFVLGEYWSDDDAPKSSGAGVFRKDMGEGCYMELNGGTLTIKAPNIVLDAGTITINGGTITENGGTITIDGGNVTIGNAGIITGLKVAGCSGCA
jgi:phage baseplate assembly protein V